MTFLILKNVNVVLEHSATQNSLIKLEITIQHAFKGGSKAKLIRKSALEGGTRLTRSCGRSTLGKEPLPIELVAEWASWTVWKTRNN